MIVIGSVWILSPAQVTETPNSNITLQPSEGQPQERGLTEETIEQDTPSLLNASTTPQSASLSPNEKQADRQRSVALSVEGEAYTADIDQGDSVLEVMQKIASVSNLMFETRSFSGIGELVESINGKKNANGLYWFLYVNGKSAEVGVSQYELSPGDEIEWRYKEME